MVSPKVLVALVFSSAFPSLRASAVESDHATAETRKDGNADGGEVVSPAELQSLSEKLRAQGDLSVDYLQETITLRDKIRIGSGAALFGLRGETPRFFWRSDAPVAEQWLFNGRELARRSPDSGEVTVWPADYPYARDMRRVVDLVTGFSSLAHDAHVTRWSAVLGGGTPHAFYEIIPTRAGDFRRITILVDELAWYVRCLEMHFVSGQVSRFTFLNPRRSAIPSEAFDPPED